VVDEFVGDGVHCGDLGGDELWEMRRNNDEMEW